MGGPVAKGREFQIVGAATAKLRELLGTVVDTRSL